MDFDFLNYILIGFFAQLIDGALGMAYGVITTTFLLSIGMPSAAASACTHVAEVFTTGISGVSHWKCGNVDINLFKRLVIPGTVGALIGVYILTSLNGDQIKPFISFYLVCVGVVIMWRAVRAYGQESKSPHIIPLGLGGGFFDAIGGGGWGSIVTSTLVLQGKNPRLTIGSVNAAEFFVTVATSVALIFTIGVTNWNIVIGLLLGGAIAAPFAGYLCRRLPFRPLAFLIGLLVFFLSLRTFLIAL